LSGKECIEIGCQFGPIHIGQRQLPLDTIDQQHHDRFIGTHDRALELAPPIDGRMHRHPGGFTHEATVVFGLEEWALDTGRRHLQRVMTADRLFHIHQRRNLTTDALAVLDPDTGILTVDVDAHQPVLRVGEVFHAHELVTEILDQRLEQRLQLVWCCHCPSPVCFKP